jgi:hypothetical protein
MIMMIAISMKIIMITGSTSMMVVKARSERMS